MNWMIRWCLLLLLVLVTVITSGCTVEGTNSQTKKTTRSQDADIATLRAQVIALQVKINANERNEEALKRDIVGLREAIHQLLTELQSLGVQPPAVDMESSTSDQGKSTVPNAKEHVAGTTPGQQSNAPEPAEREPAAPSQPAESLQTNAGQPSPGWRRFGERSAEQPATPIRREPAERWQRFGAQATPSTWVSSERLLRDIASLDRRESKVQRPEYYMTRDYYGLHMYRADGTPVVDSKEYWYLRQHGIRVSPPSLLRYPKKAHEY